MVFLTRTSVLFCRVDGLKCILSPIEGSIGLKGILSPLEGAIV